MSIIDSIQLSGVTYQIQGSGGGGNPTVELTQAEYDALVTAGTVSADTYYIITDAQAGDLTNYYTKSETNTLLGGKADTATTYTKTEVDNAITGATSTKQDTLVSGTNIKTINNTSLLGSGNIDIQGGGGGGKAIEAGRGIAITTGETADTVSFSLPISAGTGTGSLIIGDNGNSSYASYATALGAIVFPSRPYYGRNYANGESTFAHGSGCSATTSNSHAEGSKTKANSYDSHTEGQYTVANSTASHAEGAYTVAGKTYNSGSYSHAEGYATSAITHGSHAEGLYTFTSNDYEHASGQYNVSNTGSTNADKTLFSVGNGTADNARHNAFEIRQNGDMYLNNGTSDIKLQDYLQIKVVKLTQSAYDALSPNYDSNTLYVIVN